MGSVDVGGGGGHASFDVEAKGGQEFKGTIESEKLLGKLDSLTGGHKKDSISIAVSDDLQMVSFTNKKTGEKIEMSMDDFLASVDIDPAKPNIPPPLRDRLAGAQILELSPVTVSDNPWCDNCAFNVVLLAAVLACIDLDKSLTKQETKNQLEAGSASWEAAKSAAERIVSAAEHNAQAMRDNATAELVKACVSLVAAGITAGCMGSAASGNMSTHMLSASTTLIGTLNTGIGGVAAAPLSFDAANETQQEGFDKGIQKMQEAAEQVYKMAMDNAKENKGKTHDMLMQLCDKLLEAVSQNIQFAGRIFQG